MPFDGIHDARRQYLLDKLDAVANLLMSEHEWCKRHLRQRDGSRCLLGALIDAKARWLLFRPLLGAVQEVTGVTYWRVESFNDAAETDFALVRRVLDHLRVSLISGTYRKSRIEGLVYSWHQHFQRGAARAPLAALGANSVVE